MITFSLAGCVTQPAMAPSHITLLHSGRMLVVVPVRSYYTLTSPYGPSKSQAVAVGVAGVIGGAIGGAIAGAITSGGESMAAKANAALLPYADQIRTLYPKQAFLDAAQLAADHVHWMGKDPAVNLYGKAGVPGSGKMSHLVQSSSTQAIVFVNCAAGFSADMKAVAVMAQVEVYARGARRGNLIDGGVLEERAQLANTGPQLKPYGYEGIAAGKQDDRAAQGARANLWFKNDGKRYKAALAEDMQKLQVALVNYLDGRRTSK